MRGIAVLVVVAVLTAGCSGGDDDDTDAAEPASTTEGSIELTVADPAGCEVLDEAACILPFPSNAFTVADETTDTGLRVAFGADALPANADGVRIDPAEWNRNDGFSPGSLMMTVVPDLDPEASALPPITDIELSLADDAPIVLVDADTGDRVPFWAELDANAEDLARQALIITPAVALLEGHRHVVALRGLVDTAGDPIESADAFRAFRDRLDTGIPEVEARREAMEQVFADLDAAGVARDDLYIAWDFTVASERSLSERLLHIRDDAFGALGSDAPAFTVTETAAAGAARIVRGTYEVPNYMTGAGEPGETFNNDDDPNGIPTVNGTYTSTFVCTVPTTAEPGTARAALYGHGLLGTADQVIGIGTVAATVGVAFCATDFIGMSTYDVPNAAAVLADLGQFRSWADRLQQGHLNFLYLGRLMRNEAGFAGDPAFQDAAGAGLLDGSAVFYLGASQGGILGGATSAVAQDWERVVLAVPAMNYSVLLRRSIDFDEFAPVFETAYPDELDRQLGLALVQMLWDRGENQGYAQHLTADPYADTPPKTVLLLEAFGDHQVANIATENLARTIGAGVRSPALAGGRSTAEQDPHWNIEPIDVFPHDGSAMVVWDFGTPAPPTSNTPPRAGDDPHGKAADVPEVLLMVSEFLKTDGAVVDVCNAEPCQTLEE